YGNGFLIPLPPTANPPVPPGYNTYYDDRTNHPLMYNPYLIRSRSSQALAAGVPGAQTVDRTFGPEEMRILNETYNYADLTTRAFSAMQELQVTPMPPPLQLLAGDSLMQPYYQAGNPNRRWLVTTQSNDINLPGSTPWLVGQNSSYGLNTPTTAPNQPT